MMLKLIEQESQFIPALHSFLSLRSKPLVSLLRTDIFAAGFTSGSGSLMGLARVALAFPLRGLW